MPNKLFRCYKCNVPFGIEFMADGPKCPKCSSVGAPNIVQLTLVHFVAPDPEAPIKYKNGPPQYVACKPGKKNLVGENFHATCEVRAVTCPMCVKTEAFKLACLDLAESRGLSEEELLEEHPRLAGRGMLLIEQEPTIVTRP